MRKIRLLSPPCRPRHSVEEPSIARTHRPGASPAPAASGRCLELGRSVGGHAPPGGSRQQSACGCALRDAASCGLAVTLPWPMPRCCWRSWAAQISCVVSCASPGGLATGHTYIGRLRGWRECPPNIDVFDAVRAGREHMVFVNCVTDVFLADNNAHTTATIKYEKGEADFDTPSLCKDVRHEDMLSESTVVCAGLRCARGVSAT